jgi:hypothetical protein
MLVGVEMARGHPGFLPGEKLLHCKSTTHEGRRSMSQAHAQARALEPAPERLAAVAGSQRAAEREPVDGQPAGLRDAQTRASELVAAIAADAAASPEVYLRSTVVPEGGE